MTWVYIPGDNYTKEHLLEVKAFYEQNFQKKKKEYERALSYEKYGLPGWRWTIIRLEDGLKIVTESLKNIQLALARLDA